MDTPVAQFPGFSKVYELGAKGQFNVVESGRGTATAKAFRDSLPNPAAEALKSGS